VVAKTGISVEGLNANDVFTKLTDKGVSEREASEFIAGWLLTNLGKVRRTFNYKTAFPATDPDCVSHFARTFVHNDWHDGQDLVQAEQTSGEDGFNLRFHKIENDLDALGADVAEVFLCLASMRGKLAALLDEIKAELNTIEGDLADLKGDRDGFPTFPGRVKIADRYAGTTQFLGKPMDVFRDESGQLLLTPSVVVAAGGGFTDPHERLNRVQMFAKYAQESNTFKGLFTGQPVTKEQVIAAAGTETLDDGTSVADALAILPDGAKFSSSDTFVAGIADREGLALKTSGVAEAAITTAFGAESEVSNVSEAAVTDLQALPVEARTALATGGVTTVGALSKLSPDKATEILTHAGVTNVSAGEAAGWIAGARALSLVR
jgi:hypothetical protein